MTAKKNNHEYAVGEKVFIVSDKNTTHYAVVPSIGTVVDVYDCGDYNIACVSRTHGGKICQCIGNYDLAPAKSKVL